MHSRNAVSRKSKRPSSLYSWSLEFNNYLEILILKILDSFVFFGDINPHQVPIRKKKGNEFSFRKARAWDFCCVTESLVISRWDCWTPLAGGGSIPSQAGFDTCFAASGHCKDRMLWALPKRINPFILNMAKPESRCWEMQPLKLELNKSYFYGSFLAPFTAVL